MTSVDCRSELVLRARRERLSEQDAARLREHLAACSTCRFAVQLGNDFETERDILPGDDALRRRLVTAVLARRRSPVRRLRPMLIAVAALVLVSLSAVALPALFVPGPDATEPTGISGGKAAAFVSAPRRTSASIVIPTPSLDRREPTHTPNQMEASKESARAVPATPMQPRVESPAELFARANAARRSGQLDEAVAAYEALQRSFPASPEAQLALVSLGRLQVERGAASSGLLWLDRYLASAPKGSLAQEALFAKARALRALGRSNEERSTWSRLLSQFPGSVYADQARRRLAELP